MASFNSTATVHSRHEGTSGFREHRPHTPMCNCWEIAKIYMSWRETSPGRSFYGCPNYHAGRGCGFFRWIDQETEERVKLLLNELHNERMRLKRDNRRLMEMEFGSSVKCTIDDLRGIMKEKKMVEEELEICNRKKQMYKLGFVLSWIAISFLIVIALV